VPGDSESRPESLPKSGTVTGPKSVPKSRSENFILFYFILFNQNNTPHIRQRGLVNRENLSKNVPKI
jgi:hypothetical protein